MTSATGRLIGESPKWWGHNYEAQAFMPEFRYINFTTRCQAPLTRFKRTRRQLGACSFELRRDSVAGMRHQQTNLSESFGSQKRNVSSVDSRDSTSGVGSGTEQPTNNKPPPLAHARRPPEIQHSPQFTRTYCNMRSAEERWIFIRSTVDSTLKCFLPCPVNV